MKLRPLAPLFLAFTPLLSSAEVLMDGADIFLDHRLAAGDDIEKNATAPVSDPAGDDLVLFNNGDLMHGSFGGIEDGLFWERKDISRPIKFGLASVKQIVFNSGKSIKQDTKTSFVTLVSGDRIPGKIISLDDKTLALETSVADNLEIPREHVSSISPNPFGGILSYIGPYTSEGWMILDDQKPEDSPEEESDGEESDEEGEKEEKEEKAPQSSSWVHSGDSFFSLGPKPLVLADAKLPDVGRVRFQASWKGRFGLYLALHADLTRVHPAETEDDEEENEEAEEVLPEGADNEEAEEENKSDDLEKAEEEEEEPEPLRKESALDLRKGESFQTIPWIEAGRVSHADLFGSCYTVLINSSYPRLSRNYFSDTGEAKQSHLRSSRGSASLPENGSAEIEIRFDRPKSLVMLFVNGEYVAQWNDLAGYVSDGPAIGFYNPSSTNRVKISEIVISSWSGVADSPVSLRNNDRDIALLTNGTDRISGEVSHIKDGQALIKTDYAEAHIPLGDLSEIVFKGSGTTDLDDEETAKKLEWKKEPLTVVYHPYGRIKMNVTSATATAISGTSPFLGKITTDLEPAVMLRFSEDLPDLADWFDDF